MSDQADPIGDDILHGGAKTYYPYSEHVHPEAFRQGVHVRSLVTARGGPNLLAASRARRDYPDPLYDPAHPSDPDEHLKAMWDVTQHYVATRNEHARANRLPVFHTGPRWTGSQVAIDPLIMTDAEGDCECKTVTRGAAMNESLWQRIRYPAD